MNPGVTLIAFLEDKPDKRDELLTALRDLVKPTRTEKGCVDYHLHISDDDPNQFIFMRTGVRSSSSMSISRRRR
jgi:quinol monooxygenase YgiN